MFEIPHCDFVVVTRYGYGIILTLDSRPHVTRYVDLRWRQPSDLFVDSLLRTLRCCIYARVGYVALCRLLLRYAVDLLDIYIYTALI